MDDKEERIRQIKKRIRGTEDKLGRVMNNKSLSLVEQTNQMLKFYDQIDKLEKSVKIIENE